MQAFFFFVFFFVFFFFRVSRCKKGGILQGVPREDRQDVNCYHCMQMSLVKVENVFAVWQ